MDADANTGWSKNDAIRVVDAVRTLGSEHDIRLYIEQPCLSYEECLNVRQHTHLPFILDECMDSLSVLLRGYNDRAMDLINLKINRMGGLTRARQVRDLCISLGICMTIEDSYKDISVCHVNIRSIKSDADKFRSIKTDLANKFDIITLSETWLDPVDGNDKYKLMGYHPVIRRDRVGQMGGGVLAWVSLNLIAHRRADLESQDIEALWLDIRSKNNKFLLCVTYRTDAQVAYWENLQDGVDRAKASNIGNIVITGDLNADPRTNHGQKLNAFIEYNFFTSHINEPTRITETSSTLLDQFITNIPFYVKNSGVKPPVSKNDNCTIFLTLLFRCKKKKAYTRRMWDYENADFNLFRNTLQTIKWEECFNTNDVNIACERLTTNF